MSNFNEKLKEKYNILLEQEPPPAPPPPAGVGTGGPPAPAMDPAAAGGMPGAPAGDDPSAKVDQIKAGAQADDPETTEAVINLVVDFMPESVLKQYLDMYSNFGNPDAKKELIDYYQGFYKVLETLTQRGPNGKSRFMNMIELLDGVLKNKSQFPKEEPEA